MVEGFEEYTHELTDKEKLLLPFVKMGLANRGKNNPITGAELIKKMNIWINGQNDKIRLTGSSVVEGIVLKNIMPQITQPRLLKIIQHFRASGQLPILAVGGKKKGYYVSYDQFDIKAQIRSLEQRAKGVLSGADGLRRVKIL